MPFCPKSKLPANCHHLPPVGPPIDSRALSNTLLHSLPVAIPVPPVASRGLPSLSQCPVAQPPSYQPVASHCLPLCLPLPPEPVPLPCSPASKLPTRSLPLPPVSSRVCPSALLLSLQVTNPLSLIALLLILISVPTRPLYTSPSFL